MPSATTHGYPFPVGTDRVMDGDNAIQALAQYSDDFLLGNLAKVPRCRLTNASVVIPTGVVTLASFVGGTIAHDTDGMGDLANSRIYARHAGWYVAYASIPWPINNTGMRLMMIAKNGNSSGASIAQRSDTPVQGTSTVHVFNSEPVSLVAGDYVDLRLSHSGGTSLTLVPVNGMGVTLSLFQWMGG